MECLGTWSQNRHKVNIDNIRKWRSLATAQDVVDGMRWYPEANAFAESIVRETGVDLRIVIAVISALSPQNPWEQNKVDARNLILAYVNRMGIHSVKVSTFNTNKAKAWEFLAGHSWENGPKTTAFVDNIANYRESVLVTVDIWAARVAMDYSDFGLKCPVCKNKHGKPVTHGLGLTATDYAHISELYAIVAAEYGELPLTTQAICWVAMKNAVGR